MNVANARYDTYAQAIEDCGTLSLPDICNNQTIHEILSQDSFDSIQKSEFHSFYNPNQTDQLYRL